MSKHTIGTVTLWLAIVCLVLAAVILTMADGIRRWYSGGFFAVMGVVMLANWLRWRAGRDGRTEVEGSTGRP